MKPLKKKKRGERRKKRTKNERRKKKEENKEREKKRERDLILSPFSFSPYIHILL